MFRYLIIATVFISAISCNNNTPENKTVQREEKPALQAAEARNAIAINPGKNSLMGTYMGDLPCDGCSLKTMLTFSAGNRAHYRERPIGTNDRNATSFQGTYTINSDSTLITITDNSGKKIFFRMDENRFIPMADEKTLKDCEGMDCSLKKSHEFKSGDVNVVKKSAVETRESIKSTGTFEKAGKIKE